MGNQLREEALARQRDAERRRAAPRVRRGPPHTEADAIFRAERGHEQQEREHPDPIVRQARESRDRRAAYQKKKRAQKAAGEEEEEEEPE